MPTARIRGDGDRPARHMIALQPDGTRVSLRRLAGGASADVFEWSQGCVVKLFKTGFPREAIETELHHARIAHALGVPTPRVDRLVELGGRTGIVLERCDGPTLYQLIVSRARPAGELAAVFFELQQAVHRHSEPRLPVIQERLATRIHFARGVPDELKNEALTALRAAPQRDTVCHGDFHPINVILSARGPMAVDWLDAGRGDPAIDVARAHLMLEFGRPAEVEREFRAAFLDAYVRLCNEAWSGRLEELERWRLPVLLARLAEPVRGAEREALLQRVGALARSRSVPAAPLPARGAGVN